MALLAGELETWPSMGRMVALLRSAELEITVGRYSIRVEGHQARFVFQQYGGDLGDPVIEADAESIADLLSAAQLVSIALVSAGVVHRFELYNDVDELAFYLHHNWPPQTEA